MRGLFPGLALLVMVLGPAVALAQETEPAGEETVRIGDLAVVSRSGAVSVSFRLFGALDAETRARIASGLETEFEFRLEVTRRRRLWVDEKFRDHRIQTSVRYDSLSRRYGLTLKRDGEVERSSTTDRADEMEQWLTFVRDLPLGAASDFVPPEEFTVRVKADFPPRFILLFIPWDRDTSWERASLAPRSITEHEPGR